MLHPGFPAAQGSAHLLQGMLVSLIPAKICVLLIPRELISCMQRLEEEFTQVSFARIPRVFGVDRDGVPDDCR